MSQRNHNPTTQGRDMFKLEILGIEDFIRFVNLIKGGDLDADKIKTLTDSLNKEADILIESENKQEKT